MSHILITNEQFLQLTKLVDDIKLVLTTKNIIFDHGTTVECDYIDEGELAVKYIDIEELHDRIDDFVIDLCNNNIPDNETE